MRTMLALVALVLAAGADAAPVTYAIDAAESRLEVHTRKAGFLARMGHTHDIRATALEGTVQVDGAQPAASRLELAVQAPSLKVMDGGLPEKDRATVQKNMEGPQVLDVLRFPVIRFRSTAVAAETAGPGAWKTSIRGVLGLHGQEKALDVVAQVALAGDRLTATGTVELSQKDFGIKPFRAALGAVGVADAVRVTFTIVARRRD